MKRAITAYAFVLSSTRVLEMRIIFHVITFFRVNMLISRENSLDGSILGTRVLEMQSIFHAS